MSDNVKAAVSFFGFVREYSFALSLGGMVLFGASAHALVALKTARDNKEDFTWVDVLIALVVSAFAGTIFGIGAAYFYDDPNVLYALSGIGAFLGLNGLNKLTDGVLEAITNRVNKGK